MGRKRRRINNGLPKYVYSKHKSWIYRPYLGRENGVTKWGKDVYLCPKDSPMSAMYAAYERAIGNPRGTVKWLLTKFHESAHFKNKLKPRTQADYESYQKIIIARKGRTGTFGDVELSKITKRTIRKYLDTYKDGKAPIAANRHIQYLKAAWNHGEERYDEVPANPCLGVKLNEQTPRDRYVHQEEYEAFKATTKSYVPLFMELAYLCRARWNEVRSLKVSDLLEEGIRLERGKGSEGEITAWTPRLRAVVAACKDFNKEAPSPLTGSYLIHNKRGKPISRNAFQTAWGRAMRSYATTPSMRFTFHDLKACGYSDQVEQSAGHKSQSMHKVYNRKLRVVEPAE